MVGVFEVQLLDHPSKQPSPTHWPPGTLVPSSALTDTFILL